MVRIKRIIHRVTGIISPLTFAVALGMGGLTAYKIIFEPSIGPAPKISDVSNDLNAANAYLNQVEDLLKYKSATSIYAFTTATLAAVSYLSKSINVYTRPRRRLEEGSLDSFRIPDAVR